MNPKALAFSLPQTASERERTRKLSRRDIIKEYNERMSRLCEDFKSVIRGLKEGDVELADFDVERKGH